MKPCALIIPGQGSFSETVSRGYRDVLTAMDWDVIHHRCLSKLEVVDLIENHGLRLIFTQCRTGTRQLPIDAINANGVAVLVQALPFNSRHEPLGGKDSYAEPSDPEIIGLINRRVLHTPCAFQHIDSHFHRWIEMDLPVLHLPLAGDLLHALPGSLEVSHDIAMVFDLLDKPDVASRWVAPLVGRLFCYSLLVYGDGGWERVGVPGVRPVREAYDKLADIYGRATISPNLHETWQRGVLLNDQAYMIQLCGGFQITDNPLAAEMFGSDVIVADDPTAMIGAIEEAIRVPPVRGENTLAQVEYAATHHTYFNRLITVLNVLGMREEAEQAAIAHVQATHTHVSEMEYRIGLLTQEIG